MKQKLIKLLVTAFIAVSLPAWAWQPTKPIEAVVGFAPGSTNELLMRTLAQEVEKNTSVNFIVNNRPGAGGVVGSEYFSKLPGDGHHVMLVSLTGLTAMDMVAIPDPSKGRSYTLDSFTYVIGAATTAYAIIANPNDSVNTAAELLKEVTTADTYLGSSGGSRMVYETLNLHIANNSMVHVPYGGPAQQIIDVAGGNLRFGVVPAPAAAGFMSGSEGNRIKVVAVTSAEPLEQWPTVRTLSSVSPNLVIAADWGLLLPTGTPKEVQDWYVREFTRALRSDTVQAVYDNNLLSPIKNALDPVSYRNFVVAETKNNQPVVDTILATQTKK